jgi:hypothetical protein
MLDTSGVSSLTLFRAQAPLPGAGAENEVEKVTGILQTMHEVLPASDLFLGGVVLVLIVLLHGTAMRKVQMHCIRRSKAGALHPTVWRADLMFAGAVALMLGSHLVETVIWTAVLVWGHLANSWRGRGVFYREHVHTLGYGRVVLADGWKMLCPIIAISGLFTFGWTGSVLVDVVGRVSHLRELAEERRSEAAASLPSPGRESPDVTKD